MIGAGTAVPTWVEFDRSAPEAVVALVRLVATTADAGAHGDGVEVVVEAPKPRLLADILGAEPAAARIAVTGPGGRVGYPFHIELISDRGGRAARVLRAPYGWATSDSAGRAFLMQKGRGSSYDWAGLVTGALWALSALRPDARDEGWRAAIDREVRRR